MPEKFEKGTLHKMNDIALGAGEKIIHTQDVMPYSKKPFTEKRSQEPGPAGD